MSYAIAAANGSSKDATEIEISVDLAKTAIVDSPVESADEEDKTSAPKSEKNSKPKDKSSKQEDAEKDAEKAEKIKKSLAPAPLPVVNAWGSSIPSAAIDEIVKTKDDILTAASRENSKNSSKPAAAKQGKEKWVPFKAAVVLPAAPKSGSSKSQKKNKKKVKDQSNKQNRKKVPVKQQQQQQAHIKDSDENTKKLDKKQPNGTSSESAAASNATPIESNVQKTVTPQDASSQVPQQENLDQVEQPIPTTDDQQHEQSQQNLQAHHNHQNNHKPYRQFNNGYRKYQGRQQYNNNNGVFIPFNNRQQHPQGFHGFIPAYSPNAFHPRPFQPIYPQQAAPFAAQDPLPSLTYQLDYYFSLENLVKDIYLRKQMNSQGFIPLTVIFNFFRVNALSSGNYHLVVDALKYCMNIESRGSDNGIKVRALNDWEKWVLPISQREESGKDESVPEPVSEITQTEIDTTPSA